MSIIHKNNIEINKFNEIKQNILPKNFINQSLENNVLATLYGEPLTILPKDLYIPPHALEVFLHTFEGPLDFLLYLIRKQGINILDIPMKLLTAQYLSYVEQIRHTQFELAAEYLLMAAMLIEIKTRMMLPQIKTNEESEEDPRAELMRKLISYKAIKKVSYELQQMPTCEQDFWLINIAHEKIALSPVSINIQDIIDTFKNILNRQNLFEHHQIIREQLSVREYMSKTLKFLQFKSKTNLYELILHNEINYTKMGIIVYFLAILELVKEGFIYLKQSQTFAPIYLEIAYETN